MQADVNDKQTSPPSTKNVLGIHLHHKVCEMLQKCFFNLDFDKVTSDQTFHPVDKITGMLLERSDMDIHKMLKDRHFLEANIIRTLRFLSQEHFTSAEQSLLDHTEKRTQLTTEQLGEIIFARVQMYDEGLAPQITGMLLELDASSLMELLQNEDSFQLAVYKSKLAIDSTVTSPTIGGENDRKITDFKESMKDNGNDTDMKDFLGNQIYEIVFNIYLNKDVAAKNTGMILEMDVETLISLVENKVTLMAAVNKAYTALTTTS
ncbi:uncharacterized protein LOC131957823 [Physella acuta]|uniref:uncharacterized protein LOC131957823 n=1 Tax=Physella acuta TaxID=109671 RepID=UPI0027DBCC32|nr:uncharacterized protein LOC131957823 [Physella acuta]